MRSTVTVSLSGGPPSIVRRALTKSDSLNGPLVSDRAICAASGTALILGPALRRGAFFVLGRPAGITFG